MYVAVLAVVSVISTYALPRVDRLGLVSWASTNVANLAVRPLTTLAASAFVSEDPLIVWAVLTSAGLFLLVHRFGNRRAAILTGAAHVLGTLVSEGIAALRLAIGAAPTALRHIADVGPSYVTVSALVAVACFGPGRWQRGVALAGWLFLAPFLFEGITGFDVAAIGHVVAMATGVAIGVWFRSTAQLQAQPRTQPQAA
jgi:hypothetical protein